MINPSADPVASAPGPVILVPEVRDFVRINAEVVGLLNEGHRRIRLDGAGGQRLLAAGLSGLWDAVIEIDGPTGPELAANLDAPNLRIVARGPTLDGAGRGLRAGTIIVLGDAGDCLGSSQAGGILLVRGRVGHRAGLNQAGGILVILGSNGRLAGDRQAGGTLFLGDQADDSHPGRGQTGGRRVAGDASLGSPDREAWTLAAAAVAPWVDPADFDRRQVSP